MHASIADRGAGLSGLPVAILAGGLATRLRPITETIPKGLVEVAGRPFLETQLIFLRDQGFRQIVLCVGYLGYQIEERYGDGSSLGVDLRYSHDGAVLLGTGGALRRALPMLGAEFLVLYGDSYLPVDFGHVVATFRQQTLPALMTVYRNEDQWDGSNVFFEESRIRQYSKRKRTPEMRHIDYGLMAFRASVFVPYNASPLDLADILEDLVARKELAGLEVSQRFYEIGSHSGLAELDRFLSEKKLLSPPLP